MERNEKQNGGLSTGFLLGIVVGVVITLLLTTKRGKRILKIITEEGMSKISNFEDLFNDAVEEYQTKPAEPKLPPVDLTPVEEQQDEEKPAEEKPKSIKRFFKGIHRPSIN